MRHVEWEIRSFQQVNKPQGLGHGAPQDAVCGGVEIVVQSARL
jgi:hypothetical protein